MICGELKLDIGCGRRPTPGFIGLDKSQFVDEKGQPRVDMVRDVEKQGLPFCDNSAVHIIANSFLEHIVDLEFVLNECWRVLKPEGILEGVVPVAGTDGSFRDPTHKRFFTETTFDYFCGRNPVASDLPAHPRYAHYGFLPWVLLELTRPKNDGCLNFKMKPRKTL